MSFPHQFPRVRTVALRLPVDGYPVMVPGEGELPHGVCAIVPLGGTKFDTVLFGTRTIEASGNLVRIGAAKDTQLTAAGMTIAEPLAPEDKDISWRLWERGQHPGDIKVEGHTDDCGRPMARVLAFLDFSKGFQPADDVTLPLPLRRALAEAMQVSQDPKWQATAEALDPGGQLRRGLASEGREVFTLGAVQEAMQHEHDRPVPVAPMRDFRFQDTLDLLAELKHARGVMETARPDLAPHDIATQRIGAMADAFARADAAEFARLRGQVDWILTQEPKASPKKGFSQAAAGEYLKMLKGEGEGAGAHFFRDLVAKDGIIDTLAARLENPDVHQAFEKVVAPAREIASIRIPEYVLAPQAIRVPRTVDEVARGLKARDSYDKITVLALDDDPMARGQALQSALVDVAVKMPHKIRALHNQTLMVAEILREEVALGSRDPGAARALARLDHGLRLIEGIERLASHNRAPKTIQGALEGQPRQERVDGRPVMKATLVTDMGARLDLTLQGADLDLVRRAKPGQQVSVSAASLSRPSSAPRSVAPNPARVRVASGEEVEL